MKPDAFAQAVEIIYYTPCPIPHMRGKNWAANAWQEAVYEALGQAEFDVQTEFYLRWAADNPWKPMRPGLPRRRRGFIDIMAKKNGVEIAIELDFARPRQRSLFKLWNFPGKRIIGLRSAHRLNDVRADLFTGIDALVVPGAVRLLDPSSLKSQTLTKRVIRQAAAF